MIKISGVLIKRFPNIFHNNQRVEVKYYSARIVGMLGLLEALETIKVITGLGETLIGRILHFDGETMSF